jgi:hypothetical protein
MVSKTSHKYVVLHAVILGTWGFLDKVFFAPRVRFTEAHLFIKKEIKLPDLPSQ